MVRAKTYQRMYERAMLAESRCVELQDQLNEIALELSNLWQSFQRVTARPATECGATNNLAGVCVRPAGHAGRSDPVPAGHGPDWVNGHFYDYPDEDVSS